MSANSTLFTYPHGLLVDDQDSIYVAQWNSGRTYPIKLERMKASRGPTRQPPLPRFECL